MVLELRSRGLSRDNRAHKREIEEIVEQRTTAMYEEFKASHIAQLAGRRGIWAPGAGNPVVGAVFPATDMAQSALQRSLETRSGRLFEALAREIGELSYEVSTEIPTLELSDAQSKEISALMLHLDEGWTREGDPGMIADARDRGPRDYQEAIQQLHLGAPSRTVDADFLDDRDVHHLVEIKASGKLNKSGARAEKLKLISTAVGHINHLRSQDVGVQQDHRVDYHLCTALDGDLRSVSPFVRQYWAEDELMLGADFWRFVTQLDDGPQVVWRTVRHVAQDVGRRALDEIISEAFPPTLDMSDDEDPEIDEIGI